LLVGEKGVGPWQTMEYYEALDRRVKQPDFPVVLVLLNGQPAPGLPFLRQLHWVITPDPASEKSLAQVMDAAAGNGAPPGELWRHTAPYRGLAAMTEADSDYFFGRGRETVEVINALSATSDKLPILLGNSGVGKSSLAQAGAVAALMRQAWPETAEAPGAWPSAFNASRRWCFLKLKPGTEPVRALVEPFLWTWQFDAVDPKRAEIQSSWVSKLLDGKVTLRDLLDATQARYRDELHLPEPPAFLIYIDQGEELYVRAQERERRQFSEILAHGLADQRLHALMSMRSDFLGDLQRDEALFAVHRKIDVPPLREPELKRVIRQPAEQLSARFESEELVRIITRHTLEDSAKDVGALPLLSYTLDDMWTEMVRRGDGVIRLPAGAFELGGVLAERANAFLARNPNSEAALRRVLTIRLAAVRKEGDPTRRRARRSEFSDEEWRLVTELADHPNRLLVTAAPEGGDTYAEVAHETIFSRWDRLREWINAEREFLAWKTTLDDNRRQWEEAPKDSKDDALLLGLALIQAQSWLAQRGEDLSRTDREFITFSLHRAQLERQREEVRKRIADEQAAQLNLLRERASISRRRRRWTVAAACVLVAITGVAIWQWSQAELGRKDAAAARDTAQNRLGLAQVRAEDMVKFIATDLRTVQGIRTNTLERLLNRAKKSFDELSSAVGDDPQFQQSRAQMMSEFGETFLKAKGLDQASNEFEQSLEMYRDLAAKDPSQIAWQRGIADQSEHIGVVRQQKGDIDQAMENFRQALNIRQAIAAREPGNAISHRDLAWAKYNIGEVLMARRKAKESLESDTEALTDMQRAISIDPSDLNLKYKLSLIHSSMGVAHEALGSPDKWLASYLKALDIRKHLHEANPDNADWTRMLAWAYSWIGSYYLDNANVIEAMKYLLPSLEQRRMLARTDPGDLVAKYDLAWAYHYLGMAFQQQNDLDAAAQNFDGAYKLRKELAELDKTNAKWQRDLALSYETLGDVAVARKEPPLALDHYQSAINILEELISRAPNNGGWRDILAIIYNKSAFIQKCRGDAQHALAAFEKALAIRDKLLAENPEDLALMLRVARSEDLVGEALRLRGEPEKALLHYRRAAELANRILARRSEDTAAREVLAKANATLVAIAGPGEGLRACPGF
jgi:tetratricopeptide (TPR) repeat protein